MTLKEQAQADGVKVVLTIQRFGWTEGTLERTRALLGDRQARRGLADRIARLVDERGFDGVNLDVEPVPEELADEYVDFVREVRAALDAVDPELHLSVDVVPGLSGYDLAGLTADDAADLAIIMGYNFRDRGRRGGRFHGPAATIPRSATSRPRSMRRSRRSRRQAHAGPALVRRGLVHRVATSPALPR